MNRCENNNNYSSTIEGTSLRSLDFEASGAHG